MNKSHILFKVLAFVILLGYASLCILGLLATLEVIPLEGKLFLRTFCGISLAVTFYLIWRLFPHEHHEKGKIRGRFA